MGQNFALKYPECLQLLYLWTLKLQRTFHRLCFHRVLSFEQTFRQLVQLLLLGDSPLATDPSFQLNLVGLVAEVLKPYSLIEVSMFHPSPTSHRLVHYLAFLTLKTLPFLSGCENGQSGKPMLVNQSRREF